VTTQEREHAHPRLYHVKDGWKATEFWLALIVVLVACAIVSEQARVGCLDRNGAIALAAAAITSFGYSRARASVKSGR
jgi:hypothetical protein